MKKITRLATVLAAFAMLFAFAVPASAQSAGLLVFQGTANVSPGLGLPPNGVTGTWEFKVNVAGAGAGSTCADFAVVNGSVAGPTTSCQLDAEGDLGPNLLGVGASCGMSEGTQGTGDTATYNGAAGSLSLSNYGWITSAGGTIPFTGDIGATGKFVSLVQAQGGQACVSNSATTFTVVGVGAAVIA